MKNIYAFITLHFCALIFAQFTSPGNGTSYTLSSLSAAAPTVLQDMGDFYWMSDDITISATDHLVIDENKPLKIDSDKALYVYGDYSTTATDFLITAMDAGFPFKGIRFESGSTAEMKNTKIEYGGGVRVLTDNFLMDNCILYKNIGGLSTSGAVSFFSGSPVVTNSQFIENSKPGIGSGVSNAVSVTLENNYLFGNNTENSNAPQINIGMGISDSVKIINNTIIGNRELTKVGGISVSMLTGGSTRFRIEGNTVKDNRYGITSTGSGASGIIKNNILENNNTEVTPANGGSGIAIYAAQNIIIRNNQIRGNLWGITVLSGGTLDLGTEDDFGNNIFKDNGNGGVNYAFYNNTPNPVSAVGNCWREDEISTPEMVAEVVWDIADDAGLGEVNYTPFLCGEAMDVSNLNTLKSKIYPNPSNGNFTIETEKSGNYILTDMSGKIVGSGMLNKGKNVISKKLPVGVYHLILQSEGNKISKKILIR